MAEREWCCSVCWGRGSSHCERANGEKKEWVRTDDEVGTGLCKECADAHPEILADWDAGIYRTIYLPKPYRG